jgi:hypothetical protein
MGRAVEYVEDSVPVAHCFSPSCCCQRFRERARVLEPGPLTNEFRAAHLVRSTSLGIGNWFLVTYNHLLPVLSNFLL